MFASVDELWSRWDIAQHYGVAKNTVHGWVRRYEDFPPPVAVVGPHIHVYKRTQIERWVKRRRPENPRFGVPIQG